MNQGNLKHIECMNFAAIDVVKGMCHLTKEVVLADHEGCSKLDKAPKCKFCESFLPGKEEFMGICTAEKERPETYPDLKAVTCEMFRWRRN